MLGGTESVWGWFTIAFNVTWIQMGFSIFISIFFNIYRHKSVVLTQFHLISSSTKLHWPSTTKYQPVPPHTDPVPPNTNQHCLLLSHYYHVSTSFASYWPSIIIYRPPLSYTVQVPQSTKQYHIVSKWKMSDFPLSTWDEQSCTIV